MASEDESAARDRALHYRKLADAEPSGTAKQMSYREIADLLDKEADVILAELKKRMSP